LDLCSRIVRASLKPEFKAAAMKRAELGLKFAKWSEGKQSELSTFLTVKTYSLKFYYLEPVSAALSSSAVSK
jgi:hypothetical protein